ncbi:MAG: ABC transporter substrate-binding protein [Acidothermaceae bacterium]
MTRRILAVTAAVAALTVALAGCSSSKKSGSGSGGHLVIGSADFSEQQVLANLYALLAQNAGYTTTIQTVTTREIYEPALEKGQIDIVPDYAATFTEYLNDKVNGANAPVVATSDKDTTLAALNKLAKPRGLTALEPSDAADENAFAVTKDFATKNNLKNLSDVGAAKLPIKLAAPAECKSRPFCGGALTDKYGINITKYDPFDFDSVPGKKAVQNGNDDMVEVATDDGTLDQFNLVILQDDKHVQLADNLVPIVGKKYANDSKLAAAINVLAPVLTSADLGAMDAKVDTEKKLPADVAKAYLVSKKLIKG